MNPAHRGALEVEQLSKLRALITTLRGGNSFYQKKLAALGENLGSIDEFTSRMPLTTKQELVDDQRAHPPFGTNLSYPLETYTRFNQTSGTSGEPLRWLDTPESWSWMLQNWAKVFQAAGVKRGDRVYFAFSFGPFLGFWTAFEAATQLGLLCIPGGGLSSEARLRAIVENGAKVLCCTPTYALRLGEVANEPTSIRAIIVAGEPGGSVPEQRRHIEKLWPGARVFDHHGMTETGPVSYEHPDHPGALCIIESSYLAEVIDLETGEPCRENETGELVLTALGREAAPLLRYRTGDLVRMKMIEIDSVPTVALDGGILGRIDDMVIIRGVNIFPAAVEKIIRAIPSIAEYRVEIERRNSMYEMRVIIEARENSEAAQLEIDLNHTFALRIPVRLAQAGELPKFEMKAKRWIRIE